MHTYPTTWNLVVFLLFFNVNEALYKLLTKYSCTKLP